MATLGNYQGYQGAARHPGSSPLSSHVTDARLELLAKRLPGIFSGKSLLDIGCNDGAIAVQLGLNFGASRVRGVDVDQHLIGKARQHFSFRRSRVRVNDTRHRQEIDYYPISALMDHGYRLFTVLSDAQGAKSATALSHASEGGEAFTPDISFTCQDWVSPDSPNTAATHDTFEVIMALSVVKWVHLAHFDQGLERFFSKCSEYLDIGGLLVLEVHPWKSYERAVQPKKSPGLKPNLEQLQLRPDDFSRLLSQRDMKLVLEDSSLPRSLTVYQKISAEKADSA